MPTHPSVYANAEPRATRYEIADDDVAGLRMTVQPSGFKSWCLRYVFEGRDVKYTLGGYTTIPVAKARKLAADVLLQVRAGRDPQAAKVERREEVKTAITLGAAYEDYLENPRRKNNGKPLRESSLRDIKSVFNRVYLPKFKSRPLKSITDNEVMAAVEKSGDVRRVFAIGRAFFGWAKAKRLVKSSPFDGLTNPGVARVRDRKLDNAEIKAVWDACSQIGYPFGPAVQLLLLTGARREEIAAAKRKEIKGRYLIVPPDRAKKDREHRIYLADEAMAIMAKLPRIRTHGGFVFTTTGKSSVSGWSKAKDRLDELSGVTGWTIHDLRRTVASGMQSIGIPIHITEKCLAHHSGTFAGITGVYQQFGYEDEIKDAWERWAKRLMEIVR